MFWQQTHQYDIDNSLNFQFIVDKYFSKLCGVGPEFENNWNGIFEKYDNRMSTLLQDIVNYNNLYPEFFNNDEKEFIERMFIHHIVQNL